MNFEKDSTKAKKAWFWFDEEWVALGAGIESSSNSAIVTGINQCLQKGNIIVDGKPYIEKSSGQFADWIVHDEIAYVFPNKTHVNIKGVVQKGNLQRIYGLGVDSIYSQQVFSLWFDLKHLYVHIYIYI